MSYIRIWLTLLLILVLISTSGCTSTVSPNFRYETSEIASIEFVSVDSQENVTVIRTLDESDFDTFLLALSQLEAHAYWNDPIEDVNGYNIKITLTEEMYHLINCASTAYYSGEGIDFQRIYYDSVEFAALWQSYAGCDYTPQEMGRLSVLTRYANVCDKITSFNSVVIGFCDLVDWRACE